MVMARVEGSLCVGCSLATYCCRWHQSREMDTIAGRIVATRDGLVCPERRRQGPRTQGEHLFEPHARREHVHSAISSVFALIPTFCALYSTFHHQGIQGTRQTTMPVFDRRGGGNKRCFHDASS